MTHWIIVFEDRPSERIFRFLRKGFRHCYAFRQEHGGWRKLDPMNPIEPASDIIPVSGTNLLAALAASGAVVLQVKQEANIMTSRHRLCPLTCVEILKHLLGMRASALFTPWGLYRRLATPSVGKRLPHEVP